WSRTNPPHPGAVNPQGPSAASRTLRTMVSTASARPARGRQVNAFQALALLLAFVLMAGLGGVLAAGLVMPVVASASSVTDTSVRLFDELPSDLEQVPLSEKSTILAADGTVLATFFVENRIIVPLDQISIHMQNAVIATEDRRFYEHGGVDLTGMTRALIRNATSDAGKEGASTLTQQYVKNALIQAALTSEDPNARAEAIAAARESDGIEGYARKLQEAKTAIALEDRMTKQQILEAYLNIAQFGLSVYGVEAAAQSYFRLHASELNYLQAATIAGITKAPGQYDPFFNGIASENRRNEVLRDMLREGFITQAEYDQGVATSIYAYTTQNPANLGCEAANDLASSGYFCDYVTKVIAQNPAFGDTPEARANLLYRGGLTITTTLDLARQQMADDEVKAGIPVDDPSGVASAISVVEPGTGKILAMAQNRIFDTDKEAGPGRTSVNYNADFAYGASQGFAPGSTFKPFTLVQWLKEGHSLNERIDGRLRVYKMNEFSSSCSGLSGGEYEFGNAEGDGGNMTVLEATMNSVNSGYIKMASELDLCGIMESAKSMGVHQASGSDFAIVPANVLGSDSVAPLTMAAAFATFAANGKFCEPIAITSVLDTNGAELPVPQANCRDVLAPQIASAMNYALGNVWNGTGKSVGGLPDRPAAGKTGTTSRNEYTWFAGYTPQMAAVVWVGFSEGVIPVQNMTINGTYVRNAYGSTIALPTWKRFMLRAHEGLPVVGFPAAGPDQVQGVMAAVPDVAGFSTTDATAVLQAAGFTPVNSGAQESSPWAAGYVARSEPGAGASVRRGSAISLVISTGPAAVAAPPPAEPGSGGGGVGNGNGNGNRNGNGRGGGGGGDGKDD
ncbi:MAG: Peptidoglycan glycosyltransferase, partial [Actinotalea sp.]|nr:Peptidoglycan glycosyltransferase [Actinotalea sp.]